MVISESDSMKIKYEGPKPFGFVGIPSIDGNISIWNAINLTKWAANREAYEMQIFPQCYEYPHDSARNLIIEAFLQSECSHLLMLDTQTFPVAYYLDVMLAHNVDMVSAIVQAVQPDAVGKFHLLPLAHRVKNGIAQPFWAKGLQECYRTTCACTLVKREVIKSLEFPAFSFGYNEYGERVMSEDYNFCRRVREAGFKIHVDFDLLCSHLKPLDMKLLNNMLLVQRNKG